MTREEAVSLLRRYRREETYIPSRKLFGWKRTYDFDRAVYERMLILELIQRIKRTDDPPIKVVQQFWYEMDDMLCGSDSPKTWAFASIMENCATDILIYLRRELMRERRRK
jgi:hypothetical protein